MDRQCIVAVVIVCVMVATAWADVPQLINYQGRLANADGEPVSGVKSMTFEFYNAEVGGNLLPGPGGSGFTETQNVAVSDGIFQVLIGSATVGAVPQSIFAGADVYLSVTVEGEELTPRQRVASVPFAFRVANAEAMEARLAALEALLANVALNGNTMVFSGVNVQIVNGTGSIDGAVNGLGNLIVGYNELRGAGDDRSGSHNIVVGRQHSFTSYGGLVAGYWNTISGPYATVSGGRYNTASGGSASVSGGWSNTASSERSSVCGGRANTAGGEASSVSGGYSNTASGDSSSVCGGRANTAGGEASSVSGGYSNTASGDSSSVSGGRINAANGWFSSVSGGNVRSVGGTYDWRAGGYFQDQ